MKNFLELLSSKGLWIILEGLAGSSREKKDVEKFLKKKKWSNPSAQSSDDSTRSQCLIIQHGYQSQWLASQLLDSLSPGTSSAEAARLMAKQARFEFLLHGLGGLSDFKVATELYALLDAVSGTATGVVPPPLSPEASQFLLACLLQDVPLGLGLVHCLLSRCLPQFADSDAALTAICGAALEAAISQLENSGVSKLRSSGCLLQLLALTADTADCLPRLRSLVSQGLLEEGEVGLTLGAKGGSPPRLLQAWNLLEDPPASELLTQDGVLRTREAFLRQSRSDKHWLLDLLDVCYSVIQQEDVEATTQMLSHAPVLRLSPLLLLKAWEQQCCHLPTISLLNLACKKINSDPIFERLGFLLERRAIVVSWVQNQRSSKPWEVGMMERLERLSTLRVLHETKCLGLADWTEVQGLLDRASSTGELWEATLFQGFCIISSALNLVWASSQSSQKKQNSKSIAEFKSSSHDSSKFETEMIQELKKIQEQLDKLYPLSFRLEVMENLFSLLFLRYEDLHLDEAMSDSEEEGEEDCQPNSVTFDENEELEPLSSPSKSSSPSSLPQATRFEQPNPESIPNSPKSSSPSKNTEPFPPKIPEINLMPPENVESRPSATDQLDLKSESAENRGFVCSPPVIRAILECLRECLVDCTAAFYKQRGIVNTDTDSPAASMQRQINNLTQYVTEAWWRLQLLADLSGIPQDEASSPRNESQEQTPYPSFFQGKIQPACYVPQPQRGYSSSASSSDVEESPVARRRMERAQRRLSQTSRQSRSDHTDKSSESSSTNTAVGSVASSLKIRRRARSLRLPDETDSLVRVLLASPVSLATMCLARGDCSRAYQVIQTYQLTRSSLAAEARFLEVYQKIATEICQPRVSASTCVMRDYSIDSSPLSGKLVVSSSLEMVRLAASTGINSAGIVIHSERILPLAPEIHGLGKIISEYHGAGTLLAGLSGKAMAACDLALTLGPSREASLTLLEVVSQHWSPQEGSQTRHGTTGLTAFMLTVRELFRSMQKICQTDSRGLPDLLSSWELPLTLPVMKQHASAWSAIKDTLTLYTEQSGSKTQVTAIKKLIEVCASSTFYCESRGLIPSGFEPLFYLKNVFLYLQTLASIVNKSSNQSSGHYGVLSVLSESWVKLLGRLVFDIEAPLGRVERVATRLHLDLLHATVATCCPQLHLDAPPPPLSPALAAWGKISLNATPPQQCKEDIPMASDLVTSLLNQLITTLQANSNSPILSPEDFTAASLNLEVLQVLGDTTKLSNVDLGVLTQQADKVAFLTNVSNLLFLHALVVLGPDWGLVSPSWAEKRAAFNCVGYHVGQMGFVPLSGLMKQLLGQDSELMLAVQDCNDQYWSLEEKRAMFVLSQGTVQSPAIQVLEPGQIDSTLDAAMSYYISRCVRVEGSLEGCLVLVIPPLVLRHLGLSSPSALDQGEEARDEPAHSTQVPRVAHLARDCAPHLPALLGLLQRHARGQLQKQLSEWADRWHGRMDSSSVLLVTVEEHSSNFGVVLQSSNQVSNPESMQSSLITIDEMTLEPGWESKKLTQVVGQYLEHHCWLVALLAKRLRQEPGDFIQLPRTSCLDRFLIDYMSALAPLGAGNLTLAALQPWRPKTLWPVLDQLLAEQRETESAGLILNLPESYVTSDVKLQTFRDLLLYHLASQPQAEGIYAPWRLALLLGTSELRAQCVLDAIKFWPGSESMETLKTVLGEPTLTPSMRNQINNTLHKVSIYQQVHQALCYYQQNRFTTLGGWYDVWRLSETDPGQVLQSLIDAKQFRLCLPWAELHGIPHRAQHLVNSSFLSLLLETETSDFASALKLLRSVPLPQAVSICRRLLGLLTSLPALRFVVGFALDSCVPWLKDNPVVWSRLQLWGVGLAMLAVLPEEEQLRDKPLASQPHLLLEQLLMNTRLAVLATALNILRTADLSALPSDSLSQPAAVDAMLRRYAGKALDLRVSRRSPPEAVAYSDEVLLLSLSTGSISSEPTPFVMPAIAPPREHWVPNDEVTECMCCLATTFSMFNRRHHCRRCGRVVCGSCSNHRAKVDGYEELAVRVCDDCCGQMRAESSPGEGPVPPPSSSSSQQARPEWRLLGEEPHDATVREEFGFEHAPSVALCLSVLGLHSEHAAAQPRFLLEAADQMLQLLVPSAPGQVNPELDYALVIRMARSLVVAAKVRYARAALNSGVAHCDRLLGQVDLLALLVRSGCTNLLPGEPLPLGGHALRHLRDRLVGAELWPLALEVSTKAGLERGGVWAAWGKACLRAGRWNEAREHLAHCLQSPGSAQDPAPAPLLGEILRILQESNYTPDPAVKKQAEHISAPALTVLHSLASLGAISQGKMPVPSSEPLHYSESQFYLRRYGSTATTLGFFLSHADVKSALRFARERLIEPEVFAEALYKPCLRQGLIKQLHQEMSSVDPTLELWKPLLLHAGRLLERQGLLHSLYQLQLYARDLVRAAMTCIRFYRAGARCYSDLAPEHLHRARVHLEEELTAAQWESSSSRDRDSESPSTSADSPELPAEAQLPLKLPARQLDHHVSTICRQLEAGKFLAQCEGEGRSVVGVAADLARWAEPNVIPLIPTLFGNSIERAHLSTLVILCGKNVEEGFGVTFRIIQDFRLHSFRIYSLAAKWLTARAELERLEQLVGCIRSSGSTDSAECSDRLLLACIGQLHEQSQTDQAESLVGLVIDPPTKVEAHLLCGQLKSAYLLAVKLGRVADVRAVLAQAERNNQPVMRRICTQWLDQNTKTLPH